MSCWPISKILAQARTAGVIVELDAAGNLRLRSPNEPPQAMVEHLRSHKDEIVAFLRARAEAERAESRLVRDAKPAERKRSSLPKSVCEDALVVVRGGKQQ
jgi:hypothetical protein